MKNVFNTYYNFKKNIISLFFVLVVMPLAAQQQNVGVPYIKNYLPSEFGAHVQNFDITQDSRDVMYFANFSGVLQFDGENWRVIQTENISQVMTLSCNESGKVFVGARGEIGYLQADSIGSLNFKSLMKYIPVAFKSFVNVVGVFSISSDVYFVSDQAIFIWNGIKMEVVKTTGTISSAFSVRNKIYVFDDIAGLQYLELRKLHMINTRDVFSKATVIKAMIPFGSRDIIIATSSEGIKVLNEKGVSNFTTAYDQYLTHNNISCGVLLQDNTLALGTEHGGLIVFYSDGSLKQIVNNGLQDNNIHQLFVDNTNHLWLALDHGIAQVEIPSDFSFFDKRNGLVGAVKQVIRNNSKLFFATQKGLFTYNNNTGLYESILDDETTVWSMLSNDSKLLIATSKGVFEINDQGIDKISSDFSIAITLSNTNDNIVYVGLLNGVSILEKKNDKWRFDKQIPNLSGEVSEIVEDVNGNTWFLIDTKGIVKYNYASHSVSDIYNKTKGLPSRYGNHLSLINHVLCVSTQDGLYTYNSELDSFEMLASVGNDSLFVKKWIFRMQEDNIGNIWYTQGDQKNISIKSDVEGQSIVTAQLQPIKEKNITHIYCEEDNTVWFAGSGGAIRFKPTSEINTLRLRVLLRTVRTTNDQVLFLGQFLNDSNEICVTQPESKEPVLDYSSNSMAFTYASPSYSINEKIEYQYILDGFDKTWSFWSDETQKEYTNIPAGEYIFKVRSRNVYGVVSDDLLYRFVIAKPFYQSWIAILLYVILFLLIVFVSVRARSKKLIKEKKNLEDLIEERTAEVVLQKEELESQSKELSNKNEELEKINLIVKSINAEIEFSSLLQSILDKIRVINAVEKATIIVRDKVTSLFTYKVGNGWGAGLPTVELQLNEVLDFYLFNAEEVHEDIYNVRKINYNDYDNVYNRIDKPLSAVVMVVKLSDEVEGFLVLENMRKKDAFDTNDFSLLKNLKEHIISAFIKTNLLENIQKTLDNLKATQAELIEKEKLASIGQLTKGIVDRILNPLNYINNFSVLTDELSLELSDILDETKDNIDSEVYDEVLDILQMVKGNVQKITEHGNSATRIVKGMETLLQQRSTEFVETDINALLMLNANKAIQEFKTDNLGFDVNLTHHFDDKMKKIMVLPTELATVFASTVNNACFVLCEKSLNKVGFRPEIDLQTMAGDAEVIIKIKDNGCGISAKGKEQLFSPFYTTKPTSKGTGLGLYLNKDIVKLHNGTITVDSKEGEYTCFVISLPNKNSAKNQ